MKQTLVLSIVWGVLGLSRVDAAIQFVWSGGVTPTSARVNGKVSTDSALVRLAYTDQSDFSALS